MAFELIDTNDGTEVLISKGDISVQIRLDELSDINDKVNREVYYREDVMNEIRAYIENGDLPEQADQNKAFVEAVLDEYTCLRMENEGDADGLDWHSCITNALDNVDYSDYSDAVKDKAKSVKDKAKSDVER